MSDQIMQLTKYVLRNLRRHAFLSILIIVSLSIGLISSFYVLSYVNYENSYDAELTGLYRVNFENVKEGEEISRSARTSPALGPFLSENFPVVTSYSRMVMMGEVILMTGADVMREKDVLLADSAHFRQFDYHWKYGSPNQMNDPQHVVITESLALKLFGEGDPTGTIIEINSPNLEGTFPFTVAGVVEDRDRNSHLRPEMLISYATLYNFIGREIDQSWNWNNLFTYVMLNKSADSEFSDRATHAMQEVLQEEDIRKQLVFQEVSEIHTNPGYSGEFSSGTDAEQLTYLLLLSCLILAMTYLNFVNLFVVRTLTNAKQMGIRAILGSSNWELLLMSITDILLLNFISFILAITIIQVLNPFMITQFDLPSDALEWLISRPQIVLCSLLLSVAVSSMIPVLRFLKANWSKIVTSGKLTTVSRTDIKWYGSLLGIQFFIALFFLSGLVVVYHQMWLISKQDPGLDLENKWVIKAPFLGMELESEHHDGLLWSELQSLPGVTKLVAMNEIPGTELYWRNDGVGRESDSPVPATFSWLGIGAGYMELFDIKLLAGRDFDPVKDNFDSSVIINFKAARTLGFNSLEEALGQKIFLADHPLEIVGVVQDFHQEGFKKLVEPQYFRYAPNDLNYFVIAATDPDADLVKEAYQRVFPGAPFEMYNLTEHYRKQYAADELLARSIFFLSVIALVIAVVGIVGMSLQILRKKSQELIIRKIHGASGIQLWNEVAVVFYRIAFVAYLVSTPLAYMVFRKWADGFTIGEFPMVGFLLIPAGILLVMVILSISWQTISLTRQNPKDVLVLER